MKAAFFAQVADLDWPFDYLVAGILPSPLIILLSWIASMFVRRRPISTTEWIVFAIFAVPALLWSIWFLNS